MKITDQGNRSFRIIYRRKKNKTQESEPQKPEGIKLGISDSKYKMLQEIKETKE